MQTVNFNNEILSKLSLGTVQFGLDYGISNKSGKPRVEEVQTIVDYVQEHGINCFDTASAYGNSEEILGKVLNTSNAHIISKLKSELFLEDLEKNVDLTLKRLQKETLYGLLLHDSKLLYEWNDIYTLSVEHLKNKNKIKYFGVSIYTNEDFSKALENDSIELIQIPFSIFDQRALTLDWFEKAKKKNKLIFIRSVFLQGLILMDKNLIPDKLKEAIKYIEELEVYCERFSMSKSEIALSYVNSVATESVLLFGCDDIIQAKENIETFNALKKLSADTIDTLYKSFKDVPEAIYNPIKW